MANMAAFKWQIPKVARPIKKAKGAVNNIIRTLQLYSAADTGITVDEIIEGGSLGCGTAIPKSFDIDLVIYSRRITAEQVLSTWKRKEILEKLNDCLKKRLKKQFEEVRVRERSLKFHFIFAEQHRLEVDLLISPFWTTPTELSAFIHGKSQSKTELSPLSAGGSKWQTDFIRHQPERYKEYIKRAKYWRKFDWPGDDTGKPSSFLMTMLVLEALERSNLPPHGKIPQHTKKSMVIQLTRILRDMVKNHSQLCINMGVATSSPGTAPCVTDPGNSANNLYFTGFGAVKTVAEAKRDWDVFAMKIDHLNLTKTFESIGLR